MTTGMLDKLLVMLRVLSVSALLSAAPGATAEGAGSPVATAPEDVEDITRIVNHITGTSLLEVLSTKAEGLRISMPESQRVYTVKLLNANLIILTENGKTYRFPLESVL